jgi:predicted aspartyl protease
MMLTKRVTAVLLALLVSMVAFGQAKNEKFDEVYKLIEQKNYFTAKELYRVNEKYLSQEYRSYVSAFLNNAFGDLKASDQNIAEILKKGKSIPDSLKYKLYNVKEDNAVKSYNYREAKEATATLLTRYSHFMSPKEVTDFQNRLKIWTALENEPKQTVSITGDTRLKMEKDKAGINNLKVEAGAATLNFIFDTGANISTTCQSVAKQLNMKIIPTSIEVGTITGSTVAAQLAVCDRMTIGNIEIRNAIFLVLDDANLTFAQIDYRILGIIGFPIIEAMKEIQITQDGYFMVPQKGTTIEYPSNMAMNGLTPLIFMDRKHFTFDTGADKTMLYETYYQANKAEIDSKYKLDSISFGGAGGLKKFEGFKITHNFTILGKTITLKDIDLLREKRDKDGEAEDVYGNIGQDLIRQFSRMTLNFDKMFIKFD